MTPFLAALSAVVAACGGGSGDDASSSTEPSAATSTTVEVQAQPDDVVLRQSDFRMGWEEERLPQGAREEATGMIATMVGCIGELPPSTANAISQFKAGAVTRAISTADLMASVDDGRGLTQAMTTEQGWACQAQGFAAGLGVSGLEVSEPTAAPVAFPALGDEVAARRISASLVTRGGERVTVFLDLVVIRKGPMVMTLSLVNPGAPFVAEVGHGLAAKMVARA